MASGAFQREGFPAKIMGLIVGLIMGLLMKIYIKNDRGRYEELGDQWEGFPADGWWFVGDGRRNLVVPIDAPRPLQKLRYQQYRNALVDRIADQNPRSLYQLVEDLLDHLEELVDAGH